MQHYLKIYALAVCFVSIICVAITSGFAIYNLFTLAAPRMTIDPYQLQFLRSNDAFVNSPETHAFGSRPLFPPATGSDDPRSRFEGMSAAEITRLREQRMQEVYADHVARAQQSLLRQVIIIVVASALFASHWLLSQRIGNNNIDNK